MLPDAVEPKPPKPVPDAARLLEACDLNCRLLMMLCELDELGRVGLGVKMWRWALAVNGVWVADAEHRSKEWHGSGGEVNGCRERWWKGVVGWLGGWVVDVVDIEIDIDIQYVQ